ncbi:MAG: carboxypeptidase regulatory-like domain-containing protein [Planctomycetes bacterium]|nr:carboxypeptidase regulatory-like domain-containing protein [Planctomycetota bacterium]
MRRIVLLGIVLVVLAGLAALVLWRPTSPTTAPDTRATGAAPESAPAVVPARDEAQGATNAPVVVEPKDARSTASSLPLDAPGVLRVHVVAKETGAALTGWRVRLVPEPAPRSGWSTQEVDAQCGDAHAEPITAGEGWIEFECTPGTSYALSAWSDDARAPGAPTSASVLPLAAGEQRELVLAVPTRADLVFFVRVLDLDQRAPVAGARVRARVQSSSWSMNPEKIRRPVADRELGDAATDATGLARLELCSWDRPYVEVEAAGFGRALASVDGGHATPETALDVLLTRAARLSGTLVGASAGEVLLRTRAWELLPGDQRSMLVAVDTSDATWSAKLAPDGRFAFDALPAGCELNAEHWPSDGEPMRVGTSVKLSPGEERVVEWHVSGRCTVHGRVLDGADVPVTDTVVWLVAETSPQPSVFGKYDDGRNVIGKERTNAKGEFTFADVPAGKWQAGLAPDVEVRFGNPALDVVGLSERFEIAQGETQRELLLRVDRGLFVSGVVRAPDGSAPPHAFVQANGVDGRASFTQNTSDGTFHVGPVLRGRYRLSASGEPHAPTPVVEVEAGAKDVVLTLTAGAAIHGRVVDASGAPPPYEVQLAAAEGSQVRFAMMATTTDPNGEFKLDGLEAGTYDVVASTTGGRYGVKRGIVAQPGKTAEVALELDAGVRLRVRSAYEQGSLLVRSDGALIHMLQPDPKTAVECALPPGRITVELVKYVQKDGTWSTETITKQSLDVAPGETKELVLEAPK